MCSCRCRAGPVTACPRPEAPSGVPRDLSVLEARVSAGPAPRPRSAALGNRSVCPSRRTGGRGGQHGELAPRLCLLGAECAGSVGCGRLDEDGQSRRHRLCVGVGTASGLRSPSSRHGESPGHVPASLSWGARPSRSLPSVSGGAGPCGPAICGTGTCGRPPQVRGAQVFAQTGRGLGGELPSPVGAVGVTRPHHRPLAGACPRPSVNI